MSILPTGEKGVGCKFWLIAATDMIVGELAGAPTKEPELLDPEMIRHPFVKAACPAAVKAATGPLDMATGAKITAHRFAIAQFIPVNTLARVPVIEFVSTLPTKIDER